MVAAGMAGGLASIVVIRRFLPDTPYFNRMMLESACRRRARGAEPPRIAGVARPPARQAGQAATPLVPAGKVQFGDELVDVSSNGELLPKGTPVVVDEVTGSIVVVSAPRRLTS